MDKLIKFSSQMLSIVNK